MADYNKAIELNPKFTIAYINRGVTKCKLNDLEGGKAEFTKAIETDSTVSLAYYNRAVTEGRLKDYKNARIDFKKAALLDTNYNKDVEEKLKEMK